MVAFNVLADVRHLGCYIQWTLCQKVACNSLSLYGAYLVVEKVSVLIHNQFLSLLKLGGKQVGSLTQF